VCTYAHPCGHVQLYVCVYVHTCARSSACPQAVQGRDPAASDGQTGFPSIPENPAQGRNYPRLPSAGSPAPQVCPQHPGVSGSGSRLGEQRGTVGKGRGEPRNGGEEWVWSMGGPGPIRGGREGGGMGPPPAKELFLLGTQRINSS